MTTEPSNVQWPEDFGHQSEDVGNFVLGVRNDNDIAFTDADLDYSPLSVDSSGAIKVVPGGGTPFDIRPLDCDIDSITICPPASGGNPFEVEVINEVNTRPLDCLTDSITICPPATGLDVTVTNEVNVRQIDCATDSITVCPPATGNPFEVTIIDQPISVTGTINILPARRSLRGLYYGSSGAIAYTTAADAATAGDLWIVNTSSTVVAYIREVRFTANLATLALLTALPRINLERMTFTGTPSGAQITPAKRDSTDATNTATVRTASTGMTITAGAVIKSFSPPSADVIGGLLAANAASAVPVEQIFVGDIDSFIVLRQNQGIVFRQATAGSATESRVYNIDFMWEEI